MDESKQSYQQNYKTKRQSIVYHRGLAGHYWVAVEDAVIMERVTYLKVFNSSPH